MLAVGVGAPSQQAAKPTPKAAKPRTKPSTKSAAKPFVHMATKPATKPAAGEPILVAPVEHVQHFKLK